MAHGQHAQAAQLLRRVEDDGRESRRHLRVEADLDPRLDLIFALDLRADGVNTSRRRVDGVRRASTAPRRRAIAATPSS